MSKLPRHPRTGLMAVGLRLDGRPIWPIMGGSEPAGDTTGGAQSGATGTGEGAQGGTGSSITDTTTDSDAQSGESTSDERVSRADFDKLRNQLAAADRRREEVESKLREQADKEKTELERATERAKQLEVELQTAQAEIQKLQLERAMLTDPEWGADKWHDPEDVLARLDAAVRDSSIQVDDGRPDPKSVKTFLKGLADKRKYLLKTEAGDNGKPPKSGDPVGAGDRRNGGGDIDATRADELRRKYRIR
jgi:hypothetical protein